MRWPLVWIVALGLAGPVSAQPGYETSRESGRTPEPEVSWIEERPRFVRGLFFADGPWGEPLAPPRDARSHRWGFYVWGGTPLWLIVEIDGAPEGRRLCVAWSDPADDPVARSCQALPRGPGRLAFPGPDTQGWPEGGYAARLYFESRTLNKSEAAALYRTREPLAEIAYAVGEELPMTAGPGEEAAGPDEDEEFPSFPWPPPRPTTRMLIERTLLAGEAATLGEVATRLAGALGSAGYAEHGFYAVPGGFALATRLEQIESDGTPRPEPGRWSAAFPTRERFSLADYIRALFTAPEAHYRVIVFIVNDKPFATTGAPVAAAEADAWIGAGLDRLPAAIARQPLGPRHAGAALIYQFRKVGHERDPISNPSDAAAADRQLERSGILAALGR